MNIKPEKQFTMNGFPCVIAMDLKGFRRAFVGLPKEHPLFRVAFMDSAIQNINYRFSFSSRKIPTSTTFETDDEIWWLGLSFRFDTKRPFWEELKALFPEKKEEIIKRERKFKDKSHTPQICGNLTHIENTLDHITEELKKFAALEKEHTKYAEEDDKVIPHLYIR